MSPLHPPRSNNTKTTEKTKKGRTSFETGRVRWRKIRNDPSIRVCVTIHAIYMYIYALHALYPCPEESTNKQKKKKKKHPRENERVSQVRITIVVASLLSSTPTRSSSIGTRRKRWQSSTGWTSIPRSPPTRNWQGSSVSRRRITRAPSRGGKSSSPRCGRSSMNRTPPLEPRFVYIYIYIFHDTYFSIFSVCIFVDLDEMDLDGRLKRLQPI